MKIEVSLIIPVYNVEKYLERCLNSVLNQTEPFEQIILVNDGSTDNSLAICEKYAVTYNNIQIINKKNEGLSIARNTGVKYAKGNYIMFLDSDDWLRVDAVSILKNWLTKTSLDAIYFDAEVMYEDGLEKDSRNQYDRSLAKLDGRIMKGMEYFHNSYPRYYVVSACLAIYRKELIEKEKILFPKGLYYEDNYFTFVFLQHAKNVLHISEKLYKRLYHPNSIVTSAYSAKKFTDYIRCVLLIWNEIIRVGQEKEFIQFMSGHCNTVLNNFERCINGKIFLDNEALDLLLIVLGKYVQLLNIWEFPWTLSSSELILGVHNLERMIKWKLTKEIKVRISLEEAIKLRQEFYLEILKVLPLNNPSLKIGMYGTGNHTEGLLNLYEKMIGSIDCELIFIDSKRDNEIYNGKALINYKKIDESFDLIIVSSFLYEKDMVYNLKSLNLQVPIYSFYDGVTVDMFTNISDIMF